MDSTHDARPASAEPLMEKGRFTQTCGPCGAVFEVVVMGGLMAKNSSEGREDYACPECGHPYHCRGNAPPRVTLISPRRAAPQ